MHILIINFELKDLSVDDYAAQCEQIAPAFAPSALPGLIQKLWLSDPVKNTFGGVYVFEDAKAVENYKNSELFAQVASNPNFANMTLREFGVLDAPTAITTRQPAAV